jgi:hypothetical protein
MSERPEGARSYAGVVIVLAVIVGVAQSVLFVVRLADDGWGDSVTGPLLGFAGMALLIVSLSMSLRADRQQRTASKPHHSAAPRDERDET